MELTNKTCTSCKEQRAKEQRQPRRLYQLEQKIITQPNKDGNAIFKKLDLPILLCEWCDGDALRTASDWSLKGEVSAS